MDVIDVVQSCAPDAQTEERTVAVARHRLMEEIAAGSRTTVRSRRRRRGLRWAGGLVAAGAAVAVGAVVVTNLLPVDPKDPSTPGILVPPVASAAEVLQEASETALTAATPVPAAGQYLLIEETMAFLEFAQTDAATGELMPWGIRTGAEAGFVRERTTKLYVPADREDEWVWDLRDPWRVTSTYGDRADEAVAERERLDSIDTGEPDLWRLPGGRVADNPETPDATVDGRELWAEMPREPQALLDWFRERASAGTETAAEADAVMVWTMSSTLSSSLAPAELRSVIFDALALVDGMEVQEGPDATASFTYEVAGDGWQRTTSFTIDRETALITALSDRSGDGGDSVVPGDVPDEQRTVRVSVVDDAP